MHHYIMNFAVYTLAMLGLIFVAFIIAKKVMTVETGIKKEKFLSIEDRLILEPRKNIYVVKAGNERFLMATDTEGSHYLTKLDYSNTLHVREEAPKEIPSTLQSGANIISFLGNQNPPLARNTPMDQPGMLRKILKRLNSTDFPNNRRIN